MAFFIGTGIVLKQADKYILIQEVRHEKTGLFNLPAGTLEVDEDFTQCIQREAKEETGVDIELQHFLGVYQTVIASGSNVVFLVFAGQTADNAVFASDEHTVIKGFTYDEILELEGPGKLRSPIVLKAIEDHRNGKVYPLEAVQAWYVDTLSSITVEKDH
ncbi:MAG TPA: NUDIX domain-containing protein [Candidatus Saccharimonadales bacterium]|nr:NUDIX domain-containing protein [Candidatus Saccharimonadales bacterium]